MAEAARREVTDELRRHLRAALEQADSLEAAMLGIRISDALDALEDFESR